MDLSDIPVVYLDSRSALEWASQNGLSKGATIRTNAPSLLINPPSNFKVEEISLKTSDWVQRLMTQQGVLLTNIYETVKRLADDHVMGVMLASKIYTLTSWIGWASSLQPEDFHQKRLIVISPQKEIRGGGHSPFEALLKPNPQLTIHSHLVVFQSPPKLSRLYLSHPQ